MSKKKTVSGKANQYKIHSEEEVAEMGVHNY